MPKKKTLVRSPWTKDDIRQLKAYSKARTPVVEVAKAMKRTEAASPAKGEDDRNWSRSSPLKIVTMMALQKAAGR
jgi:hypothetical protein